MHLAIDVREACRSSRAGKGQWVYGFVTELLRRQSTVTLLTDCALPTEWSGARSVAFAGGLRWHFRVAQWLRCSHDVDLYVSPTSFIVPYLLGHSFPHAVVVHDLIAFRDEPHDRKATFIERLTLKRAAATAKNIFTISEATTKDLRTRYPLLSSKTITSIFAGPMREHVPANQSDGRTILCIATLCPRKNQKRLIEAFASLSEELRTRHRLVLAGSRGWDDQPILDLLERTPGAEWIGYADAEHYEKLLSQCHVFALPSLYEGFGMQILDTLQRGIPLLTSDRGSLGEVVGDAAQIVDPENVASIADGLNQVLTDASLRQRLHQSGPKHAAQFSWKRTVDLFLSTVERE